MDSKKSNIIFGSDKYEPSKLFVSFISPFKPAEKIESKQNIPAEIAKWLEIALVFEIVRDSPMSGRFHPAPAISSHSEPVFFLFSLLNSHLE